MAIQFATFERVPVGLSSRGFPCQRYVSVLGEGAYWHWALLESEDTYVTPLHLDGGSAATPRQALRQGRTALYKPRFGLPVVREHSTMMEA
jgi:hypothetical protein